MNPMVQNGLILTAMLGFAGMEWASRRYQDTVHADANDTKLELFMFLSLVAIAQPFSILVTNTLCGWLMPAQMGVLADLPWWAMFGLLLLCDDLTQYLWHRASHSPLLWPLHRAHHSAAYMSVRVVYRNNAFYYALMPGLWLSGALMYLGFGWVFVGYTIVKLAVIIGAHSSVRWDQWLYRRRALRPLAWLLERTISTPATHFAHHALTQEDGIGHYRGNYGNLLFLWDVLFGTAHITRRYPPAYGLPDDRLFGQERWYHQMFFPLLQSEREHSALRFGGGEYAAEETGSDADVPATSTTMV